PGGVDLIPDRLQDFPQRRTVGVAAVHQLRHVLEADVAGLQFLMIEDANAAPAFLRVALEGEVHFLDAMTFRALAERRLGARGGATEEDEVCFVHVSVQLPASSYLERRFAPVFLSLPEGFVVLVFFVTFV